MPRNRKIFIHNQAIFVTSRIQEGLPLVPNKLINTLLWSIMARARSLYDVRICHFVFMSNHLHMLVVVDDPEHLPRFMRYVKTESAHLINKFLSRSQRNVWSSGYDSPPILTLDDCYRYINYIYLNPSKANLVESVDDYPGVSSWEMFKSDVSIKRCKKIRRETIVGLGVKTRLTKTEAIVVLREILNENQGEEDFILEPYAFLECFSDAGNEVESKKRIMEEVWRGECFLKENRSAPVMGVSKLVHQDLKKEHQPKAQGRKMICISSDKLKRANYVEWFKLVSKRAREAYRTLICTGVMTLPAGVFLPGGGILANINPLCIC